MESVLNEIIRKYKCCVCHRPLCVPPIIILNMDINNELYKCGRCKRTICGANRWSRNHFLEEVAQNLSFPCPYPPCPKRIPQNMVEVHEANCHHRTIRCPLYNNDCCRNVLVDGIWEHFSAEHNEVIKKTDAKGDSWEVSNCNNHMFLLQIEEQCFFVYLLQGGRVAVLATRRSKYTKFNMKLRLHPRHNFVVSFDDLPVVQYDDKYHCFMCIQYKCKEAHTYMENIKNNEIDVSYFTNDLENNLTQNVVKSNATRYYLTLVADETDDPDQIGEEEGDGGDTIPQQINRGPMRRALTCPYCMTYMVAPIFTCTTGHTICNGCKSRLEKCPTCKASLRNRRNYTLEEMANDVELPCQFIIHGCTFLGNTSDMRTHEEECSFGETK